MRGWSVDGPSADTNLVILFKTIVKRYIVHLRTGKCAFSRSIPSRVTPSRDVYRRITWSALELGVTALTDRTFITLQINSAWGRLSDRLVFSKWTTTRPSTCTAATSASYMPSNQADPSQFAILGACQSEASQDQYQVVQVTNLLRSNAGDQDMLL